MVRRTAVAWGLVGLGVVAAGACSSKSEDGKGNGAQRTDVASNVKAGVTCTGDGGERKATLDVEAVKQCRYSKTGKGLTIDLGPKPGAPHPEDHLKILVANYAGPGAYDASGPTIPTRIDGAATREGDDAKATIPITTWACDQTCIVEVGPNDLLNAAPNTEVSVPVDVKCPKIGEAGSGCQVSCAMSPDPIHLLLRCSAG